VGGVVKNLSLVSSIADVPRQLVGKVFVVSVNSWEEAIHFLADKKSDVAMFWSRGVPVERFLKAVESFEGNLLVYSEEAVNEVMRSRFTRVFRSGKQVAWKDLGRPSEMEVLVDRVKSLIGGRG
jgi:hypothetical protein